MEPQEILERFHPSVAWNPFYPTAKQPWTVARVAHLYRRSAFGATDRQLEQGVQLTPTKVIQQLLQGGPGQERFEEECRSLAEAALTTNNPQELKAVWLYRMLYSPHPLKERLTLFWHNHFATSNAKVNNLSLMQRQIDTLRAHALGRFDEMLLAMTFDPAMIIWLDGAANKKGHANENYGRELMELFSLGVGNYTEKDIQEAARGLTGWSVLQNQAEFTPAEHDSGEKTLLGSNGNWTAADVVRICLAQPACGRFVVRKLFRFLIGETVNPSDEYINPLADEFRQRNYNISWLVSKMISSWLFFSDASILQRIKSPVDLVVGTVRALDGRVGTLFLAEACDRLGQALYYPPSVKGWDGGDRWINSATLLTRQNLAYEMTRGSGTSFRLDPARLVERKGLRESKLIAEFFLRLFHQQAPDEGLESITAHLEMERAKLSREFHSERSLTAHLAREAAHLALTMPEYQLG